MWRICLANRSIIKNGFLRTGAYYTTDRNNVIFELLKVIEKKEAKNEKLLHEGGPNWELFNPKGNRFFLPNSVGLAWNNPTTIEENINLFDYVDFNSKDLTKFHISMHACPALLQMKIEKWIPRPETIITLSYKQKTDVESSARNFVIAATEVCRGLKFEGYISDFISPFSGKPFFNFYRINTEINMEAYHLFKYEKVDDCTVMTRDAGKRFCGTIFTNAEYDPKGLNAKIQLRNKIKAFLKRAGNNYGDDDDDHSDDNDDSDDDELWKYD